MKPAIATHAPRHPRSLNPTNVTRLPALVPGRLCPSATPSINSVSVSHLRFRTVSARICAMTARPPPKPTMPILKKDKNRPPSVAVREIRSSAVRASRMRRRILCVRARIRWVLIGDWVKKNYTPQSLMTCDDELKQCGCPAVFTKEK